MNAIVLYGLTFGVWFLPPVQPDSQGSSNVVDVAARVVYCTLSLLMVVLCAHRYSGARHGGFASRFVDGFAKDFFVTYLVLVGLGAIVKPLGFFHAVPYLGVDVARLLFSPLETNLVEMMLVTVLAIVVMSKTLERFGGGDDQLGRGVRGAVENPGGERPSAGSSIARRKRILVSSDREAIGLMFFHAFFLIWLLPVGYRQNALEGLGLESFWVFVSCEVLLAGLAVAIPSRWGSQTPLRDYFVEFPGILVKSIVIVIVLAFALRVMGLSFATLVVPDPVGRLLLSRGPAESIDLVAIAGFALLRLGIGMQRARRQRQSVKSSSADGT